MFNKVNINGIYHSIVDFWLPIFGWILVLMFGLLLWKFITKNKKK